MSSLLRTTASDLLPAARALGPSLAERAERAETERTLPDDVVADLRDAGLFRLLTPTDLGGPEADVATASQVIAEVARHDGSAAWWSRGCRFSTLSKGRCWFKADNATVVPSPGKISVEATSAAPPSPVCCHRHLQTPDKFAVYAVYAISSPDTSSPLSYHTRTCSCFGTSLFMLFMH